MQHTRLRAKFSATAMQHKYVKRLAQNVLRLRDATNTTTLRNAVVWDCRVAGLPRPLSAILPTDNPSHARRLLSRAGVLLVHTVERSR